MANEDPAESFVELEIIDGDIYAIMTRCKIEKPSREMALVITKLEEAWMWLQREKKNRYAKQ